MTAVVVGLALAVAVLGVLVVGLLRAHAEVLRALAAQGVRLDPALASGDAAGPLAAESDLPFPVAREGMARVDGPGAFAEVADLVGVTPDDEVVRLAVDGTRPVLLAFLSSSCATCRTFWAAMADEHATRQLPGGVELVVVTKDPQAEVLADVARLAPAHLTVLMSSEAWRDYEVPVSPYFVHIVRGRVVGTGAASTWRQVLDLLAASLGEPATGDEAGPRPVVSTSHQGGRVDPRPAQDRSEAVDAELAAAGIRPGDSRLYGRS